MIDLRTADLKVKIYYALSDKTSAQILEQLAESRESEVLRAVAGNPNTPIKIIESLSMRGYYEEVVANPFFSLIMLENSNSKFVSLYLANSDRTPASKLAELAENQLEDVRRAIVSSKNVTVDNRSYYLRSCVATNPSISLKTLHKLANDKKEQVRQAIAEDKNGLSRWSQLNIRCFVGWALPTTRISDDFYVLNNCADLLSSKENTKKTRK
jgi:hypothetical protein